ncbi:MAG: helix-turn-helix domain-containing protein [Chakrabartia sp.]
MGEPFVQACALRGWEDCLTSIGISAEHAFSTLGIVPTLVSSGLGTLPLKAFARIAEHVGEKAVTPAATWTLGLNYDLDELGPVGAAIASSSNLGNALRRFSSHFELLQDTSMLEILVKEDIVTISYRILDPEIWPRHHDALFTLGIVAQIIKRAVPEAMAEMDFSFECERRETGLPVSGSQISFSGEANTISIPVWMLDAAMPRSDRNCDLRNLSSLLTEKRRTAPARDRLAANIYARLSQGEINQDELAREIGMSSRTMRRRLSETSLTFQQLLDECRMRQAMLEFKAHPQNSIAQIALRLGYAEHSNFTRAFSRWAGMPPQQYRAMALNTAH